MNKSTTISDWLRSGEYRAEIDSVYTKITRGCDNSDNESQTASVFEKEIYYLVRSQLNIEISFSKEEPIEGVIHKFDGLSSRKSGHGRLDAVVNDVVIEYKHHSKLDTEKQKKSAFEQVKDYLVALAKNEKRLCDAILTDGLKIAYFQSVDGVISNSSLRNITVDDIDRIIRAILSNQSKKFEPSNIVRDFSISPNSPSESKVIATVLYKQLIDAISEKSQMLYSEWKELVNLSKYATLEVNKLRRSRVSEIASAIYCQICLDYKKTQIIELQKYQEESSITLMAAEAFERYKWEGFDQSIIDFFGGDKTILIGCYKGKKYEDWILANKLYNIRLGKTKGSMEANRELFDSTSLLILYELGKPNNLSAYRIAGHQEMSKEELIKLDYPNKKPRKNYMTFSITPLDMDLTFLVEHHLIERLVELNANNAKGTPVFIEP